jgi:uncharacterized protein (DUF1800 family)
VSELRAWREAQAEGAAQADPEARRAALTASQARRRAIVDELARRTLLRLLAAPVGSPAARDAWLAMFWFNHFSVFAGKDLVGAALPDYLEQTIAPRIRGPFAELLEAVVSHPAMLVYLDNVRSTAGRPNENLARELLERHALGTDGGYTQADVQAVARLLTGFGLRPLRETRWPAAQAALVRERGEFLFDPRRHDGGDKRVLGTVIAPAGYDELPALCALLAAHPATAAHLARRLATWLLGDEPPAALQARAAQAYLAQGASLSAMLAVLEPAADAAGEAVGAAGMTGRSGGPGGPDGPGAAAGASLKPPLRWLIDVVGLLADGREPRDAAPLQRWLVELDHPLFGRTTPDGHPIEGMPWASSGQLMQRFEVAREAVNLQARIYGGERSAAALLESVAVRRARERLDAGSRAAMGRAAGPAEALALVLASPALMMR